MEANPLTGDVAMSRDGDPATDQTDDIAALFRVHRLRLTRLARAITLDPQLAEELVQDAFTGLQRAWPRVERPEAYLQRAVVNLGIKQQRRRKVAAAYPWPLAASSDIPEIDEMWARVVALPAKQRAVVILRFWLDMAEADIAATLGWRRGTVKSTLHRALARLRQEIEP